MSVVIHECDSVFMYKCSYTSFSRSEFLLLQLNTKHSVHMMEVSCDWMSLTVSIRWFPAVMLHRVCCRRTRSTSVSWPAWCRRLLMNRPKALWWVHCSFLCGDSVVLDLWCQRMNSLKIGSKLWHFNHKCKNDDDLGRTLLIFLSDHKYKSVKLVDVQI